MITENSGWDVVFFYVGFCCLFLFICIGDHTGMGVVLAGRATRVDRKRESWSHSRFFREWGDIGGEAPTSSLLQG